MQTKVILKQDVYGLGEEGDIKKVKAGYARNYLLPYSYAVMHNKSNLEKLEGAREQINARKEKKLEASKSIIESIKGIEIHFEENISEKGRLFGSINQNNIMIALKEKGFDIEKRNIHLKSPIKETGKYELNVSFYGNKTAKINVVVTEKREEAVAETETDISAEAVAETETDISAEAVAETETDISAEAVTETETNINEEAVTETETNINEEAVTETETNINEEALTEETAIITNEEENKPPIEDLKEKIEEVEIIDKNKEGDPNKES